MAVPLLAPRSARQTDPERRLRRLWQQFSRVTRSLEQADRLGRLLRRAVAAGPPLLVVALIALAGCAALVLTSPWPLGLTLRHLASAAGCPNRRPGARASRRARLVDAARSRPGRLVLRIPAGRTDPRLLGPAIGRNDRMAMPSCRRRAGDQL